MNKSLFQDFKPVSSKAWKQKIQVDLKGADYNDTLIWKTAEGIDVKPFYHSDDFEKLPNVSKTKARDWKISQSIEVIKASKANQEAKNALKNGAEHITFYIKNEGISLKDLLIDIAKPVHCNFEKLSHSVNDEIVQLKNKKQLTFNIDIIGNLGKTGNWHHNLKEDHNLFESVVKSTNQIFVDLSHYQNAGANVTQELGYALAHVNEYLNHLECNNHNGEEIEVVFKVSIGSNYFFEIAKIRALRQLWYSLADAYNYNPNCKILATPSKRNKTIYDYNVNMLRTTTECMSAILGGADIIYNLPYNQLFQNPTAFGERISRNQLLILKKESYFDAVNNPSDGSYYIESLTTQLAAKALELFKEIEKNSGFLTQLKEGTIQRKIKESALKEQEAFNKGELILLGTNKHPNKDEKMKSTLEKSPFLKIEKRKTLIEPIIEKRLSEHLEINRLKEE